MLKPLSHTKTLVTLFLIAEYEADPEIPAFMIKSRLRSLGTRLNLINRFLDKHRFTPFEETANRTVDYKSTPLNSSRDEPREFKFERGSVPFTPQASSKKDLDLGSPKKPQHVSADPKVRAQHPHFSVPTDIAPIDQDLLAKEDDIGRNAILNARKKIHDMIEMMNADDWKYLKKIGETCLYIRDSERGIMQCKGVVEYPFTPDEIVSQVLIVEERKNYDD